MTAPLGYYDAAGVDRASRALAAFVKANPPRAQRAGVAD